MNSLIDDCALIDCSVETAGSLFIGGPEPSLFPYFSCVCAFAFCLFVVVCFLLTCACVSHALVGGPLFGFFCRLCSCAGGRYF